MMQKVDYDNRFGFGKYCTAYWMIEPDRVGEEFLFQFPNGIKVSVARSARWNYGAVMANLSTACTYGFALGLYEVMVMNEGMQEEPEGYLTYKGVTRLLNKYRNRKPDR